jgi:hypothetical protein
MAAAGWPCRLWLASWEESRDHQQTALRLQCILQEVNGYDLVLPVAHKACVGEF